jgi:hypothetical protein
MGAKQDCHYLRQIEKHDAEKHFVHLGKSRRLVHSEISALLSRSWRFLLPMNSWWAEVGFVVVDQFSRGPLMDCNGCGE